MPRLFPEDYSNELRLMAVQITTDNRTAIIKRCEFIFKQMVQVEPANDSVDSLEEVGQTMAMLNVNISSLEDPHENLDFHFQLAAVALARILEEKSNGVFGAIDARCVLN